MTLQRGTYKILGSKHFPHELYWGNVVVLQTRDYYEHVVKFYWRQINVI